VEWGNGLLNNKIIDSLRLKSVGNGLGDEHRQHNRDRVSQGIGKLEHDNSQRDRSSLTTNKVKFGQRYDRRATLTVTPDNVAAAPTIAYNPGTTQSKSPRQKVK